MNEVELKGTIVKDVYVSAKGWATLTLAVGEADAFKTWVRCYVPSGIASQVKNCRKDEQWHILGKLSSTKDKDSGKQELQVTVTKAGKSGGKSLEEELEDTDFAF